MAHDLTYYKPLLNHIHGMDLRSITTLWKETSTRYNIPQATVQAAYYRLRAREEEKNGVRKKKSKNANEPAYYTELRDHISNPEAFSQFKNMAEFYRHLSEEYSVPVKTITNAYYRLKKVEDETEPEKEQAEQPVDITETLALVKQAQYPPVPPHMQPLDRSWYRVGQDVQVRVTRHEVFGVIVETMDQYRVYGMIHRTDMSSKGPINNSLFNSYAPIGAVLDARVLEFEMTKRRMKFSLRHKQEKGAIKLTSFEQLADVKEQIIVPVVVTAAPAPLPTTFTRSTTVAMTMNTKVKVDPLKDDAPTPIPALYAGVLEEMRTYMKPFIGEMSKEAEKLAIGMIGSGSLLKLMQALMEAKEGFSPDVSLMYIQKVKEKLG